MTSAGGDTWGSEELFEEFVRAHLLGEVPDPVEYARRAGEDGPRLRELIAVFLADSEPVRPNAAAARNLVERYGAELERRESPLEVLFEQFVRAHLLGEVPDPVEYARRAGEDGPRLRELIAVFLADSEPVRPNAAAARNLVERYGAELEPVSAGESAADDRQAARESTWKDELRRVLGEWSGSSAARRRELIEALSAGVPALSLRPATARSGRRAAKRPSTIVQLNHPQGGRAELGDDGRLVICLYGLPSEFVGSRPLVAFPNAGLDDIPELIWEGPERGLPEGIAEADEAVDAEGELRATVGTVQGPRRSLDSLLTGISVIAVGSGER